MLDFAPCPMSHVAGIQHHQNCLEACPSLGAWYRASEKALQLHQKSSGHANIQENAGKRRTGLSTNAWYPNTEGKNQPNPTWIDGSNLQKQFLVKYPGSFCSPNSPVCIGRFPSLQCILWWMRDTCHLTQLNAPASACVFSLEYTFCL